MTTNGKATLFTAGCALLACAAFILGGRSVHASTGVVAVGGLTVAVLAALAARRSSRLIATLPSGFEAVPDPALGPSQVPGRVFPVVVAYVLVSCALTINDGHLNESAFAVLVMGLVGGVVALLRQRPLEMGLMAVMIACQAMTTLVLGTVKPVASHISYAVSQTPVFVFQALMMVILVSYLSELLGARAPAPHWARLRFPGLLLLYGLMGVWTCWASPSPSIDVFHLYQEGSRLILQGYSPYIGDAIDVADTGPLGGPVRAYGYPPMTLYMFTAAYVLTGDTRHAVLASHLVAAALLVLIVGGTGRRRLLGELLGALLLVHPRGIFVLEMDWNESLALPLLGFTLLFWLRGRPWLAAVLLGATCAVKQHLLLFLPFFVLLPGFRLAHLAVALATWGLTLVPFLRNPHDLLEDLVLYHLRNPFRTDALSLPAWLHGWQTWKVPGWAGLASPIMVWLLTLRNRAPGARLSACALAFFLFFFLGRQAFCNYYHLMGGIWLFAAAADLAESPE